jgi:chorismate lyase / 3-hydroxybenzoate synthase
LSPSPASPAPLPGPALLHVGDAAEPADTLLAAFGFDGHDGLPWLGGRSAAECWHTAQPDSFRIETVRGDSGADIAAATAAAYRQLLARVRGSGQPYLLRIWNFLDGINDGAGDAERYRAFCVGRAEAVDAAFHNPPPAATAIGLPACSPPGLCLIALCGAEPGIALENPRQTPAWRYPREYGPVSPGFSRGAVLGRGAEAVLLASGTASIVGHVSLHHGDVLAQLDESLRNLDALLAEGEARSGARFAVDGCRALRVYLRDPAHYPAVAARLQAALGAALPVRYLHGDICRRELDIELEGVFAAR